MLVLVLDTSTPAVTAALAAVGDAGVEILSERVTVDSRAHGELLAPQVAAVLGDLTPEAVVAGLGPGPFTGLRVGLVTAAAFGQALELPTYGVGSLDALAYGSVGRVLAASDARRREIYWAEYVDGVPLNEPAVDAPAAVPVTADRAVGDGARRYADVLGVPVGSPLYPPPAALAALAAPRVLGRAPSERLTPLYLRRPDAVAPGAPKPVLR